MHIETKIRLDRKQLPYWSCRLIHEGSVVVEVVSKTFNPRSKREFRELHENVNVRMMKTIQDQPDQDSVVRLLILDDATKPNNNPRGS